MEVAQIIPLELAEQIVDVTVPFPRAADHGGNRGSESACAPSGHPRPNRGADCRLTRATDRGRNRIGESECAPGGHSD